MTRMNMMNAGNDKYSEIKQEKSFFNHNYQRHQRSIFEC